MTELTRLETTLADALRGLLAYPRIQVEAMGVPGMKLTLWGQLIDKARAALAAAEAKERGDG